MSMHDSNNVKESNASQRSNSLLSKWRRRFGHAIRGVIVAVVRETNFWVYGSVTAAVSVLAAWLELSAERWSLVVLCMASVIVAEMFNTSIEHLARAITREQHPEIRDALDIASGAVLLAAIGAAIVGVVILVPPLLAAFR